MVRDRREKNGPTLAQFWGAPQDAEEESMIAKTSIAKTGEGPAGDGRVIARISA
jgi:anaerobic magnesium-protoporphyrin IX monomethyl ester cyclase